MLAASAAVVPSWSTSGMGDAVRDGDVHAADPEDTIDASASSPEPAASGMPAAVIAATRDYQELNPVERHHYAITKEIARLLQASSGKDFAAFFDSYYWGVEMPKD